ncbi:MAG: 30S ribosomal protein S3, partial [Planctomycetaceae bacterium]|nr:30S ribosomal protein S3 [Planctomycetaceae bacterium]
MGQKVRPTGFRVGVMENWRSRWYAPKREFGDLLAEDFRIRKFIAEKYQFAEIAKVEIERTRDQVIVHLFTARPGVIIGRKGQEVDRLKGDLEDLTGRRMDLKIVEIANANRDAKLVAEKIAQQ